MGRKVAERVADARSNPRQTAALTSVTHAVKSPRKRGRWNQAASQLRIQPRPPATELGDVASNVFSDAFADEAGDLGAVGELNLAEA